MNESTPPRQAVLNASGAGAWKMVGGIPLAARFLYHLDGPGIDEAILVTEPCSSPDFSQAFHFRPLHWHHFGQPLPQSFTSFASCGSDGKALDRPDNDHEGQ